MGCIFGGLIAIVEILKNGTVLETTWNDGENVNSAAEIRKDIIRLFNEVIGIVFLIFCSWFTVAIYLIGVEDE